nr:cupin domain-containing protein [Desulfobacterales bacterium]
MEIIDYKKLRTKRLDSEGAKDVIGRLLIGKENGASNFVMRLFELAPGGYTPRHSHEWEHEVFIHSGEGEIFKEAEWVPVSEGNAVFIPSQEEHQFKNTGTEPFLFVCVIPSGVPEL